MGKILLTYSKPKLHQIVQHNTGHVVGSTLNATISRPQNVVHALCIAGTDTLYESCGGGANWF